MNVETPTAPFPIAVLVSGSGTTLRNLIQHKQKLTLDVEFRLVVSSNPRSPGLEFAADAGIATRVIERNRFDSTEAFSHAVFDACRGAGAQLVVMGGFLKHVLIPPDFAGRVMNIHPALIPAFCGQGLYGLRVHQAVLEYGARISGCTVHFVDDLYDHGPIILQRAVAVLDDDTPESLAQRVFQQECEVYPEAIRLFVQGKLQREGRRVRIHNC